MKVAHEIKLLAREGIIQIDGVQFPYYITGDPEIELAAEGIAGAPAIVHIGIIAENVTYFGKDGEVKVLAQSDDETNRRWAKRRAEEIVLLGLADIVAQLKPRF